ncbi:MAG TPA: hypothetical protein VKE88_02140 [Candidatus Nanoarchaeia archaeon]|nr:hypothetical protein [Candidatus Nanoarchaeia archaeon]
MNKETLAQINLADYVKYLETFKGSRYPIAMKAGGECLTEELIDSMHFLHLLQMYPILIHGGQPQINAALKEKDIVPEMKDGKRVTNKRTLDVVVKTLKHLRKDVVARLNKNEICAKEIGNIFYGTPSEKYRGDADRVDESRIARCLYERKIPVIAPFAQTEKGRYFNQNADSAFRLLVSKLNPKKVIILTGIGGVYKDPEEKSTLIYDMSADKLQSFLKSHSGNLGGMRPKLEETQKLVEIGHDVQITSPKHLLLELLTKKGYGTFCHKRK